MIKVFKEKPSRNYFTILSPMGQELARSGVRDRPSKIQSTLDSLCECMMYGPAPKVVLQKDSSGFDYVEVVMPTNNTVIAQSKIYFSKRAAEYCRDAIWFALGELISNRDVIAYIDRTK